MLFRLGLIVSVKRTNFTRILHLIKIFRGLLFHLQKLTIVGLIHANTEEIAWRLKMGTSVTARHSIKEHVVKVAWHFMSLNDATLIHIWRSATPLKLGLILIVLNIAL